MRTDNCRWISLLFVAVLLMVGEPATAQKLKTVEAEETYYGPKSVSVEEAERTALERAMTKALANAFGTILTRHSETYMDNINGESSSNFMLIDGSDVKGEWIETIGEPVYNTRYADETIIVTCKVKGKAREIVSAGVDFESKLLRNGVEDKFESDNFRNGDDLYMSFLTPVDGYLAVYLVDAENMAYCLLPYQNQTDGIYPVKANRRYLFFKSDEASPEERSLVDEYAMTCERPTEYNRIYVIFSPNEFTKATDKKSDRTSSLEGTAGLPRELTYANFQKWLTKQRKHDEKMNVRTTPITIKKQ